MVGIKKIEEAVLKRLGNDQGTLAGRLISKQISTIWHELIIAIIYISTIGIKQQVSTGVRDGSGTFGGIL